MNENEKNKHFEKNYYTGRCGEGVGKEEST